MQSDEEYDDLTAMFETHDAALQNEVFVDRVMQPIRKRARWRGPLLFGAGGLGIGAAISQFEGLFEVATARLAAIDVNLPPVDTPTLESTLSQPLLIGAALIMIVSCAAIIATERA